MNSGYFWTRNFGVLWCCYGKLFVFLVSCPRNLFYDEKQLISSASELLDDNQKYQKLSELHNNASCLFASLVETCLLTDVQALLISTRSIGFSTM